MVAVCLRIRFPHDVAVRIARVLEGADVRAGFADDFAPGVDLVRGLARLWGRLTLGQGVVRVPVLYGRAAVRQGGLRRPGLARPASGGCFAVERVCRCRVGPHRKSDSH